MGEMNVFVKWGYNFERESRVIWRENIYVRKLWLWKNDSLNYPSLYLLETLTYTQERVCESQFEDYCITSPRLFIDMETEAQCNGQAKARA